MSDTAIDIPVEAGEWVIRRELAGWSAEDQTTFDAWLNASLQHRIAYLRAHDVWQRADRLRALKEPARRKLSFFRERKLFPVLLRGAVALGLVAIAGVTATSWLNRPREVIYTTAVGGHETIPLADGSQVELNTDTVLRVSETPQRRIVRLDRGEAYFNIRHDAKRPFMVYAADHRIVDLGTKFEVRNDGASLRVSLLEGSARLQSTKPWAPAHDAVLKPGDVALATVDSLKVTREREKQLGNELGWRRGVIVFEHATLADAAAELNRYNHQQIIVSDPAVALMRIDATLPVNGVEAIVRVAEDVLGVRASKHQDGRIVISR